MKKIALLFFVLMAYVSFGQQFENGGFEDISCPSDCASINSQIDCVVGWFAVSTNEGAEPLQKVSCPGDIVCDDKRSIRLQNNIGTSNPIYQSATVYEMPQLVNMSMNVLTSSNADTGVKIYGNDTSNQLGFGAPSQFGSCQNTSVVLDPSIVNFENLIFGVGLKNSAGGGGTYDVIIDNVSYHGDLFTIVSNCGVVSISPNSAWNYGSSPTQDLVTVTDSQGNLIFENEDGNGFPMVFSVAESGLYHFDIIFDYGDCEEGECISIQTVHEIMGFEPETCCSSSLNFVLEDVNENVKDVFSICEDVYLDAESSQIADRYILELYYIDDNGNRQWLSKQNVADDGYVYGDLPNEPLNITQIFSNAPASPIVTFVTGVKYEVKLIHRSATCSWVELYKRFLYEEDLVNTLISSNIIYSCDKPESGTYSVTVVADDPGVMGSSIIWNLYETNGQGDLLDSDVITGTYTESHQGGPSTTFLGLQQGHFYFIKHGVTHGTCYQESRRALETPDCCDDWTYDASFSFGPAGNNLPVVVLNFETYENLAVTHEWYLISSLNDDEGPYTPVAFLTSTDEVAVTLLNEISPNLFYTVAHTITTSCGEFCETRELVFGNLVDAGLVDAAATEAYEVLSCNEVIDLYPTCGKAPLGAATNLSLGLGLEGNSYQASWTAAPGADYYVLSFVQNPTITCDCDNLFYAPLTYTTLGTSYSLSSFFGKKCFVWQVTAYCNDSDEGITSEEKCYTDLNKAPDDSDDGKSYSSPTETINVYPNPTNDILNVKMQAGNYQIQLIDLVGKTHYVKDIYTQTTINTLAFPSGIYLLKTINLETNETEVMKVILQH